MARAGRNVWLALALILAAGAVARGLLIALTPGEYFDPRAISTVGDAFLRDPLHLYSVNLPPGNFFGLLTYIWPYPPGFLPVAALLRWLSDHLGLSVSVLDRGLMSGVDLVFAGVVFWAVGKLGRSPRDQLTGAALVALGPCFIAVSGVHGQIDALAWLPATVAVVLWERNPTSRSALLCGSLIGVGITIKTAPGLALLALALSARDRREVVSLLGAAMAVVAVSVVPFLIAAPQGLRGILDYRGFPGRAGITMMLQPRLALEQLVNVPVRFDATTRFLLNHAGLILGCVLAPTAIVARLRRFSAYDTLVVLLLALYVFAPAILPQYWLWIVPFLVLAGRIRAVVAYQLILLPLLVATYGFLHEPHQPLRYLSRGFVFEAYVPWVWLVDLVLLAALMTLLVGAERVAAWSDPAVSLLHRSRKRFRGAVRSERIALAGLLAAGIGLRMWLTYAYRPAFLGYPDERAYLAAVNGPLFWNPYKPAGYPLFLRALRLLSPHLTVTIVIQHALGVATAILLALAVRRFLHYRFLALLPVAVVLLGGTQLYLEHAVLSDAPFGFLVAAALWCATKTLPTEGGGGEAPSSRASRGWLLGAGVLLSAGTLLRPVGGVLVPLVIVWGLAGPAASRRARLISGGAPLLGAIVVLVPYLAAVHAGTGQWSLTRTTGELFYGRAAIFADCRRFTPPPGTTMLCHGAPERTRQNANWYLFDPASPALRAFGTPGPADPYDVNLAHYRWRGDQPLGAFARAALLGQPLSYLDSTVQGLVKYVAPHAGPGNMLEWDTPTLIRQVQNRAIEADTDNYVARAYGTGRGYVRRDVEALNAYADSARVEGPLVGVMVVLMLIGWALARGPVRRVATLLSSMTLLLALAPVALLFYSSRYATPMYGPLAAGAAIGSDAVLRRSRRLSSHPPGP